MDVQGPAGILKHGHHGNERETDQGDLQSGHPRLARPGAAFRQPLDAEAAAVHLLELKRETKIKNLGSSAEFKGKNKQGVLLSMGWRFITGSVFQDGKHILAFRPVKDYYKPELTFVKEEMPRFKFQNSFKVLLCKRIND